MSSVGSIVEVSINGRLFSVAGDADGAKDLGGFTNERMQNGNGTSRNKKTAKPWMMGGVPIVINDDRGDQEFLQDLQDSPDDYPIIFSLVSGIDYSGVGNIEGDLKASTQNGTATVDFSGTGKLRQQ